jgi:diaminopimelate epimerase
VNVKAPAVPFVKASACGNDFLLIDFAQATKTLASLDIGNFTKTICDRRNGVGADGVEWMYPHAQADVEIRLVNADGSEAEISGNGTRCVAAYLHAERGTKVIKIQTGAGLKSCLLTGKNQSESEFEIEMGEAVLQAERAVRLGASEIPGIPVSMGNPHFVVFVKEFPANWQEQAAKLQRSSDFQHGVNVEMVVVEGKHDVNVRFFERGVGETQSSGTGSCASAVAAMATSRVESPVRVHAEGGTQTVRQDGNLVFLRGTARLVCRGEFFVS